jgi:hypothetical protein
VLEWHFVVANVEEIAAAQAERVAPSKMTTSPPPKTFSTMHAISTAAKNRVRTSLGFFCVPRRDSGWFDG